MSAVVCTELAVQRVSATFSQSSVLTNLAASEPGQHNDLAVWFFFFVNPVHSQVRIGTFSQPFKKKCSEVVKIGSIIIVHLISYEKSGSSYCLMLHFWWGCRGILFDIDLGKGLRFRSSTEACRILTTTEIKSVNSSVRISMCFK